MPCNFCTSLQHGYSCSNTIWFQCPVLVLLLPTSVQTPWTASETSASNKGSNTPKCWRDWRNWRCWRPLLLLKRRAFRVSSWKSIREPNLQGLPLAPRKIREQKNLLRGRGRRKSSDFHSLHHWPLSWFDLRSCPFGSCFFFNEAQTGALDHLSISTATQCFTDTLFETIISQ